MVFVAAGRLGASVLRGRQTTRSLRAEGADVELRSPLDDMDDVTGAIVVFVKMLPVPLAERLRERDNTLVLDWIDPHHDTCIHGDGTRTRLHPQQAELLSGVLCVNSSLLPRAEHLLPRGCHRCIPHAWDRRCRRYLPRRDRFSLVFFGHSGFRDPVEEMKRVVLPRHRAHVAHFVQLSQFTCHVAVRDPTGRHEAEARGERGLAYWSKSNIKLSTAAAYDANVIATRDPGVSDLLDEDYPYLTEPAPAEVAGAVQRARQEYGGPRWRRGLEQMREVKERTRPRRVAQDYLAYFRELGAA